MSLSTAGEAVDSPRRPGARANKRSFRAYTRGVFATPHHGATENVHVSLTQFAKPISLSESSASAWTKTCASS
eukprot:3328562-Prymnesium_polylepis.1